MHQQETAIDLTKYELSCSKVITSGKFTLAASISQFKQPPSFFQPYTSQKRGKGGEGGRTHLPTPHLSLFTISQYIKAYLTPHVRNSPLQMLSQLTDINQHKGERILWQARKENFAETTSNPDASL